MQVQKSCGCKIESPKTLCFRAFLAPPVGLEPTTLRLTAACSTDWAKEEYWIWTSVPSNKMYYTPIGRIMQYPFANITSCSLLHGLNIIFVLVWSIGLCLCINRRLHSRLNFRQSPWRSSSLPKPLLSKQRNRHRHCKQQLQSMPALCRKRACLQTGARTASSR